MYAYTLPATNGPHSLRWKQVPNPVPGDGEVLIEVAATAINRRDVSMTVGSWRPPAGVTPCPGLECSGTIVALGPEQPEGSSWRVGDPCCALLPKGGGYAELAVASTHHLLPIPSGVRVEDAAALPEAACVAWSALVMDGGVVPGSNVLIEGGGGGMGSFAIQLAKALDAGVVTMAGRERSMNLCWELGADIVLNYHDEDPTMTLQKVGGANVIVSLTGARNLARHIDCLAPRGRIITLALLGDRGLRQGAGQSSDAMVGAIDMGALMAKQGSIVTSSLGARPLTGPGSTADVIAQVTHHVWPLLATRVVQPVIDRRVPLRSAPQALEDVRDFVTVGKTVLLAGSSPGRTGRL